MSIITLQRASELIPNFNADDTNVLTDILNASSDVIEKWCDRKFAVQGYDELYDGPGYPNLLLYNYPIVSISKVAVNPIQAIMVQSTDTTRSSASIRIDGTADVPPKPSTLYLTSVASGVTTTNTITLNTTPTFADLATAINLLSGWKATALGIYATYPVSDLRPPQGAFDCRWSGSVYLNIFGYILPVFEQNPDVGEITAPFGFQTGYRNIRVVYQAGFAVIPNPVQQACAALAKAVYDARFQKATLNSEQIEGYNYNQVATKEFNNLDIVSRYGLYLYKNTRIAKYKLY